MSTMTWVILTRMLAWLVLLLEDPTIYLTLEGGEPAGNQLRKVIKFYSLLKHLDILYFKVLLHK